MTQTYSLLVAIALLSAAADVSTSITLENPTAVYVGKRKENAVIAVPKGADEERNNIPVKLSFRSILDKVSAPFVNNYKRDVAAEFTKLKIDRANLFAEQKKLDQWIRAVRVVYKKDSPFYELGKILVLGHDGKDVWRQIQEAKQVSKLKFYADTLETGLIALWKMQRKTLEDIFKMLEPNLQVSEDVDKLFEKLDFFVKYANFNARDAQEKAATELVTLLQDRYGKELAVKITQQARYGDSLKMAEIKNFISKGPQLVVPGDISNLQVEKVSRVERHNHLNNEAPPESSGTKPLKSSGHKKQRQPKAVKNQQPDYVKSQQPESVKNQQPESVKSQQPESVKSQQPESVKSQQPESVKNQQPEFVKKEQSESVKEQQPETPGHVKNQPQVSSGVLSPDSAFRPHASLSDKKTQPKSNEAATKPAKSEPPSDVSRPPSRLARFRRWMSAVWARLRAVLWPFD